MGEGVAETTMIIMKNNGYDEKTSYTWKLFYFKAHPPRLSHNIWLHKLNVKFYNFTRFSFIFFIWKCCMRYVCVRGDRTMYSSNIVNVDDCWLVYFVHMYTLNFRHRKWYNNNFATMTITPPPPLSLTAFPRVAHVIYLLLCQIKIISLK